MAPAPVGTPGSPVYSANSVAEPTNLTPGTGSGYAVGDLLLCFTANRLSTPTVATPSGWTSLVNVVGSSLMRLALFGKIAASTSESAPTVTWSNMTTGTSGSPAGAVIAAFTGMFNDINNIVDVAGTAFQSGTSTTLAGAATAINTNINNDLVIHLAARTDDVANTWSRSGFTNITAGAGAGGSLTTTSGGDMSGQWAYQVLTPAGNVAQVNYSISGGTIVASNSVGVHVALKPAAVAAALVVPRRADRGLVMR